MDREQAERLVQKYSITLEQLAWLLAIANGDALLVERALETGRGLGNARWADYFLVCAATERALLQRIDLHGGIPGVAS